MANMAMVDEPLLNGSAPVNTCKTKVSQGYKHSRSFMTCLDHDHRERENVRFLAGFTPVQDLWRSPSRGVSMLTRGGPHGIHVLSDRSQTKICNSRSTGVVHKDVWLARYHDGEKMFRTTTYPLEVPVNYVAGVEVAEAPGGVR